MGSCKNDNELIKCYINPFQDRGPKRPSLAVSALYTSANVGITPPNFLTFSFNLFFILVWNIKAIASASLKLFILNQDHPSKKLVFWSSPYTAQKMKFSIKDFFSFLRIWSNLLKKFLMENFIFCAVL